MDPRQRAALLAQLEQAAQNDQAAFATFIAGLGGTLTKSYWALNACAVEVPPAALARIRQHVRVKRLWPVEIRELTSLPVPDSEFESPAIPFIETSTDTANHRVAAAQQILVNSQLASRGENAVVAFFDTGLDLDEGNGLPHRVFRTYLSVATPGPTRLLASIMPTVPNPSVDVIDCNDARAHPYSPCNVSPSARHGTGVAAISLGQPSDNPYWGLQIGPPPNPQGFVTGAGHAPGASAVGVSVSVQPTIPGSNPPKSWITDTDVYLEAVQRLRAWILQQAQRVHVLNISYGGWPDPRHPVELALDALAFDEDILIVTSASNEGDATNSSHGLYSGLSVGGVHARAMATDPFIPMAWSSRGSLKGDTERFFPDVCATGAGTDLQYSQNPNYPFTGGSAIAMPLIDIASNTITFVGTCGGPATAAYYAVGTSMAAPQVSGAAALYRSARPSATAVETKAAILACAASPYPSNGSADRHSYRSRNTYGVGYVQDDLLAEYATRDATNPVPVNAIGKGFSVTPTQTIAAFPYANLTAGERIALGMAWEHVADDGTLVNLDLEVTLPGGALLAASKSPSNSYERLTFDVPSGVTSVEVRVVGVYVPYAVIGYVAGRSFGVGAGAAAQEAVVGMVQDLPQVPTCTTPTPVPDLSVASVAPTDYAEAYGSWAFSGPWVNAGNPYVGLDLNQADLHIDIDDLAVGGGMTIQAVAFRLWRPFQGSGGSLAIRKLYAGESFGSLATAAPAPPTSPPGFLQLVAQNLTIPVPSAQWITRGYDSWALIVPFTTPFSYTGAGNLHLWIELDPAVAGTFPVEIDAARDGGTVPPGGRYAMGRLGGIEVGAAPILGLIPAGTTTANPRLQVFGQPELGHTLRMKLTRADPSRLAVLIFGSPGSGSHQGCSIHVNTTTASTTAAVTSTTGEANFAVPIPVNPALLFNEFVYQVWMVPPASDRLSNGLVLRIGGGL